jgi:hypothetical protein
MARVVWICQCLCPVRHCISAIAGMAENADEAEATLGAPLREWVVGALHSTVLNPWCGLCGARSETWIYDLAPSQYGSMAEATPDLRASERAQRAVAAEFGH